MSMDLSFHEHTIGTASATGQAKHMERYHPIVPDFRFIPYNDIEAMKSALDERVAAVTPLEPIQ
jgi:acetylornithine/N-succinyldiaminopimelate aminotransferase